ncbi:MAG: bifunctional riboflavin kinase/FAD synthetase [Candidatus Gastranaerophilales bacterium]|nr:bifunctional riboflavin kinase/FAD synthetase [Candidatus Gastranaerophilales bacterium]
MKVINGLTHIHNLSLALGFFDGVHLGHAIVIKNAVKYAKQSGLESGLILFRSHPRDFFNHTKTEQIIEFNDKINMFNKLGVDYVFLLDFDADMANMTAADYMEKIILPYFNPRAITTGYNHTFGAGGYGNAAFLRKYAEDFDFKYFEIPPITTKNSIISSSSIKNAVKASDFDMVKSMLGYHFYIKSPVVHGRQIGRTINFPTANLVYPENIVPIDNGVYYVNVHTHSNSYKGVMNFGLRPTIDKSDTVPVPEVHLLDFSGNLYGSVLKVSVISKIRDEQHFSSLTQLKEQIEKDCCYAQNYPFSEEKKEKKTTLFPEHTTVHAPDYL